MIRVLVASPSLDVENIVRSIASIEFAGRVAAADLLNTDLSADVLLVEAGDANEYDWRILAELPIPVLLLIDKANSTVVDSALRAGIRGAIFADATPLEIESAVHAVNAGLVVLTPTTVAELLPDAQLFPEELAEPLSGRELEVLELLAEGLSNKLIGQALNISEHTVKTHVAAIFTKLGASSRTEAVSQAVRRGLVML